MKQVLGDLMTTVLRKDLSDPGNSRRKKGNQFLCIGSVALEKSDLPISCVLPVSLKGHKSECVTGKDKKGEKNYRWNQFSIRNE